MYELREEKEGRTGGGVEDEIPHPSRGEASMSTWETPKSIL
jgi:hypothetical protein